MDLLKILRSFEEVVFELATWLYFYPVTLFRILARPLDTLEWAEREQAQPEERRYDEAMSPPLLLIVTLAIAAGVAWAAHIPEAPLKSDVLRRLLASPQNQILFRALTFSLVPLMAALSLLRKTGSPVARETLRAPFYAQCYLAAPSALAVSLGVTAIERTQTHLVVAGLSLIALATCWFLWVQSAWFARRLEIARWRGAVIGLVAYLQAMALLFVVGLAMASA